MLKIRRATLMRIFAVNVLFFTFWHFFFSYFLSFTLYLHTFTYYKGRHTVYHILHLSHYFHDKELLLHLRFFKKILKTYHLIRKSSVLNLFINPKRYFIEADSEFKKKKNINIPFWLSLMNFIFAQYLRPHSVICIIKHPLTFSNIGYTVIMK